MPAGRIVEGGEACRVDACSQSRHKPRRPNGSRSPNRRRSTGEADPPTEADPPGEVDPPDTDHELDIQDNGPGDLDPGVGMLAVMLPQAADYTGVRGWSDEAFRGCCRGSVRRRPVRLRSVRAPAAVGCRTSLAQRRATNSARA